MTEALGKLSSTRAGWQTDIRDLIDRIVIGRASIQIQLSEVAEAHAGARILTLPWSPPSSDRKREVIQAANNANIRARPMRANARAILIEALGDAHRWLTELQSDPRQTLQSLALREGKTDRSIRKRNRSPLGAISLLAGKEQGIVCVSGSSLDLSRS